MLVGSRSTPAIEVFQRNDQGGFDYLGYTTIQAPHFNGNMILGLMNFHHQSMVSVIVSNENNGSERAIVHLSLDNVINNLSSGSPL